jgi:hypothetical protein
MRTKLLLCLLLATACGSTEYSRDGGDGDGGDGSDGGAGAADAGPTNGLVTIHSIRPGVAGNVVSEDVIFHGRSGSPIYTTTFNPDTRLASHDVESGGAVTVLLHSFQDFGESQEHRHRMFTVMDVRPGDELHTPEPGTPTPEPTPTDTLRVSFPPALATLPFGYRLDVGCGFQDIPDGAAAEYSMTVYAHCRPEGGVVPVVLIAFDDASHPVAISSGQGTVVDGAGAMTLPAWTTAPNITLNLSDAPPNTSALVAGGTAQIGGHDFNLMSYFNPDALPSGSLTARLFAPAGAASHTYLVGIQTQANTGPDGLQLYARRQIAVPGTVNISLPTAMLPRILYANIDATADQRPVVTWFMSGDLDADGGILHLTWARYDDLVVGYHYYDWTIWVPGNLGSIKLPALPDTHATSRPPTTGLDSPGLQFVEIDIFDGYGDFKGLWDTAAYSALSGPAVARLTALTNRRATKPNP